MGPLYVSRHAEGRAAEHLSARGRSKRQIMEPGITAARPDSSVFQCAAVRAMFALGAQTAFPGVTAPPPPIDGCQGTPPPLQLLQRVAAPEASAGSELLSGGTKAQGTRGELRRAVRFGHFQVISNAGGSHGRHPAVRGAAV